MTSWLVIACVSLRYLGGWILTLVRRHPRVARSSFSELAAKTGRSRRRPVRDGRSTGSQRRCDHDRGSTRMHRLWSNHNTATANPGREINAGDIRAIPLKPRPVPSNRPAHPRYRPPHLSHLRCEADITKPTFTSLVGQAIPATSTRRAEQRARAPSTPAHRARLA
jgi:hypothetical protein